MVVTLVSSVSLSSFAVWSLAKKVSDNAFTIGTEAEVPNISVGEIEGGFNLLVVGVDNDPEQGDAYGVRNGTLNDVNILVHVAADHESVTAVSIPRDLIIAHPSCTDSDTGTVYAAMSAQPVNVAYSRGGMSCVVSTIENLTGLSIAYAAQFTFKAVVKMTDAVGGVTVCLSDDIDDDDAGLHLEAGMQTISGKTALGFLRTRHGVGDGSDLSRISVQQIYLSALMRKVKSSDTLSNPTKLYKLADAAATYVKLSTSLASADTMIAMAKTLRTVDLDKISFIQYPGSTGSTTYPGKVVPNVTAATALFTALKNDQAVKASSVGRASEESTATATATDEATDTATATPSDTATATDSATPTDEATSETISGTYGQTADQETCARGYLK
ncbi:MAG: LCP family protein [Microbacteriaceae bacterium]